MDGVNLYVYQIKNFIWIKQKIRIKTFNSGILFEGFSKDIPEYICNKDISCICNEEELLVITVYENI